MEARVSPGRMRWSGVVVFHRVDRVLRGARFGAALQEATVRQNEEGPPETKKQVLGISFICRKGLKQQDICSCRPLARDGG